MHVRPVRKVSIFMVVTAKKVTGKAQKQAKMARFWPKTRHNGRVMARKIFFINVNGYLSFVPSLVSSGFLGGPLSTTLS